MGLALWIVCAPGAAWAHHSVAGFFDPDEFVEIEGVVTEALWRNPHSEVHAEVERFWIWRLAIEVSRYDCGYAQRLQ